nr:DUF4367 domain-containing protein [uncultured Oscillibacter sp.]
MAEFLSNPQHNKSSCHDRTGKAKEPIQSHLIGSSPRERLYADVLETFSNWYLSTAPEDFDEELLDAYLEEMEELAPLESSFDSETSLEEFHRRFPSFFKEEKEAAIPDKLQLHESKLRRRFGRLITAAATIAAMIAAMISVQALGVDVFGFFANWTNEFFYFSSSPNETFYPLAIGESAEYESIEDALSEFKIDAALVPSWYPAGVGSFTVTARVTDLGMGIYMVSDDEDSSLTLRISDFDGEAEPATIIEKDDSNVSLHEAGGRVHYIINDGRWCNATWIVDDLQCILGGNITNEEMLKIIDSIYEVS